MSLSPTLSLDDNSQWKSTTTTTTTTSQNVTDSVTDPEI